MKLSDDIQNFKTVNGEPVHESWLHFKRVLLECQYYGFPEKVLLQ